MISQLRGEVIEVQATSVVLDVSGVGFFVACTPNTSAGLLFGQQACLHTHLAVREDSLTLYGFSSPEEKEAFILSQSVTGVGPKLALAIVAHLTPAQLRQAILTENLMTLSKVPGVGRKMAQRLVLELKDKALRLQGTDSPDPSTNTQPKELLLLGLQGLGYSAKDAEAAWESISDLVSDSNVSVSVMMKAALRSLAKG